MSFKIKIQCFKASLYSDGNDIFLDMNQIIPTKESEEYMISMEEKKDNENFSSKSKEKIQNLQVSFFSKLMEKMNLSEETSLFKNRTGAKGHWTGTSSPIKGAMYIFVVVKSYCRVEFYIDVGDAELNTKIFNILIDEKDKIEQVAGYKFNWDNKDKVRCATIDMIWKEVFTK